MVDLQTTRHLADLSKLAFTDEELETVAGEMSDIVGLMDTIADFTLRAKPDFSNAADYSALRDDTARPSLPRGQILANAKEKSETFFRVPKVV